MLSNHASQPTSSVIVVVYYKQSQRSKDNTLTKKEYPTLGHLETAIDCDPIQNDELTQPINDFLVILLNYILYFFFFFFNSFFLLRIRKKKFPPPPSLPFTSTLSIIKI